MNKQSKKVSCIDIGSNAIKYRQYRLLPNNHLELDTFKRISLRLGSEAFSSGKMTDETYLDFLTVLKKLKKHAKKKNADLQGIFAKKSDNSCQFFSLSKPFRILTAPKLKDLSFSSFLSQR